jgi:hypothetical protein
MQTNIQGFISYTLAQWKSVFFTQEHCRMLSIAKIAVLCLVSRSQTQQQCLTRKKQCRSASLPFMRNYLDEKSWSDEAAFSAFSIFQKKKKGF